MFRPRSAGILLLRLIAMLSFALGIGLTYILCEMSGWSIAPFLLAPLERSIPGAFAVLLPVLTSFVAILARKRRDMPWSETALLSTLPLQMLALLLVNMSRITLQ